MSHDTSAAASLLTCAMKMKKREHENARKLNKAAVSCALQSEARSTITWQVKWLNVRHFNSLDVLLDELAADDRCLIRTGLMSHNSLLWAAERSGRPM